MKTAKEEEEEIYLRDDSYYFSDGYVSHFMLGVEFAQRWISVEDELPKYDSLEFDNKINVKFLDIFGKEQICTAIFCQVSQHCGDNSPMIDTWYVYPSGGHKLNAVTHWRPITVS